MVQACQLSESTRGFDVERFFKRFALAVFASILFAPVGHCQIDTATISGVITDQSGAVVAGAEVRVTSTDTNVSAVGTSNQSGVYVVTGLKPGRYNLQVRKDGFNQIELTELTLNVQDDVSRNFTLRVGSTSESISVEGNAEAVETSGSVSTVIDRQFAENLPLNGRSFQTLLSLSPGVVNVGKTSGDIGRGQFSVNGQRTDANYFTVDGVSANFGTVVNLSNQAGAVPAFNAIGGTSSLVSVDAMQEFRIQTSSFAPEYGRQPGGQVAIDTRSGTKAYHGGAFDYFRNVVFDANDWFANAAGQPRAPENQN